MESVTAKLLSLTGATLRTSRAAMQFYHLVNECKTNPKAVT